jgi:hypothetical protein
MKRLPASFFDSLVAERLALLLRRLMPPATDLVLTHLDAPGWSIVDFSDDPLKDTEWKECAEWLGSFSKRRSARSPFGPIVVDEPKRYEDSELSLRGTVLRSGLLWEWIPAPRATAYGKLRAEDEWHALRDLVAKIAPDMRIVLTYSG